MIQVIDKIKYLPKSSKKSLIDENEVKNLAFKKIVKNIKQKVKSISTFDEKPIITITGKPSDENIQISITNCEDDFILKSINEVLKQ
jgi:hypothetical protein